MLWQLAISFLSFPRSFYPNTMCFCFLWVASSVFFTNISSFIWNTQLQISLMYLFLKCSLFCEAWPYPAVRNTYSLSEYPLNWRFTESIFRILPLYNNIYIDSSWHPPQSLLLWCLLHSRCFSHFGGVKIEGKLLLQACCSASTLFFYLSPEVIPFLSLGSRRITCYKNWKSNWKLWWRM